MISFSKHPLAVFRFRRTPWSVSISSAMVLPPFQSAGDVPPSIPILGKPPNSELGSRSGSTLVTYPLSPPISTSTMKMSSTLGTASGRNCWWQATVPSPTPFLTAATPWATTVSTVMVIGYTLTAASAGAQPLSTTTSPTVMAVGSLYGVLVMCGSATIPSPTSPLTMVAGTTTASMAGSGPITAIGVRPGVPPSAMVIISSGHP